MRRGVVRGEHISLQLSRWNCLSRSQIVERQLYSYTRIRYFINPGRLFSENWPDCFPFSEGSVSKVSFDAQVSLAAKDHEICVFVCVCVCVCVCVHVCVYVYVCVTEGPDCLLR